MYSRLPGDFTGELSMLTGQSVFLTARVRRPGTVVRIRGDRFRAVLGEQVNIADVIGLERDSHGFLLTGTRVSQHAVAADGPVLPFQTNLRRVFAAGDVRAGSVKRVASAVGEGAGAGASVHLMLAKEHDSAPEA